MASVNIKFSSAGNVAGQSYEISASATENGTYSVISTISRATLLAGTYITVPDGSTWIKGDNVTAGAPAGISHKIAISGIPAPPTPAPPTPEPPTPAPPTPAPPTPAPPTPEPPTPAPPTPEPPTPAPPTPEPPTPAPPTPAPLINYGSLLTKVGDSQPLYYTGDLLSSGQDYYSGGGYCYISGGIYHDLANIIGKSEIFGTACSSYGGQCTNCNGGTTPAPPTPAPPTPAPPTPSPGGGGGGGGCLVYGTLVTMADGSFKPVEEIVIGDIVKTVSIDGLDSSDEDAWKVYTSTSFSSTSATSTVRGIMDDTWSEYYTINGSLNITFEHPVFVKRDIDYLFTRVVNLMLGDLILDEAGNWIEVTTIDKVTANVQTININVEDSDLYFANGLLVHNYVNVDKSISGPGGPTPPYNP